MKTRFNDGFEADVADLNHILELSGADGVTAGSRPAMEAVVVHGSD